MADSAPVYQSPLPIDLSSLPQSYVPPPIEYAPDVPTANPDGVTASTDDYHPRAQEEKAQLLGVAFATVTDVAPEAPYPEGSPQVADELARLEQLLRVHSPMELVQGEDMAEQQAKNLAAGGSVTQEEVLAQVTADHGAA